MRRAITVLTLCIGAQAGLTAAHASVESARPIIDEVFESAFPRDGEPTLPPAQPAPAPEVPPVERPEGVSGGSLVKPTIAKMPDIVLPKPAPIRSTDGSAGLAVAGASGSDGKGKDSEQDEGSDGDAAPPAPAERSTAAERAASRSGAFRVSSTAYCLTGTMASGRRVYAGAVAMNNTPLGSRYQVLSGPRAGETFVVEDRIGWGSSFDIAYPGDCRGAYNYGRRTISVRPV